MENNEIGPALINKIQFLMDQILFCALDLNSKITLKYETRAFINEQP